MSIVKNYYNGLHLGAATQHARAAFVPVRCSYVTVWLLLLKTLIYKTLTAFLTCHTEVILLAGSILAGSLPSVLLTDETVSGFAPFRGGRFIELPNLGCAGRQTIDREE